jgi:hypothetical protein
MVVPPGYDFDVFVLNAREDSLFSRSNVRYLDHHEGDRETCTSVSIVPAF